MTPRSIRRAAERKASKLARKAAPQLTPANGYTETEFLGDEPTAETLAEIPTITIPDAASANTDLSANASSLTGQITLLPAAHAAPYDQLLRDHQNELQPIGIQESEAVQTMAETIWRTRRLRALENAIFAKGRVEFSAQFAEHNTSIRNSLIDVHTFLIYEKQLRGLQLQESRLCRRADKARAELRTLQVERQKREQSELEGQKRESAESKSREASKTTNTPQPATQNGFVFANTEIDAFLNQKPTSTAVSPQIADLENNAKAA